VAIVYETRESVGHQAQRQLQVDGHTIYKSAYLDKSHTTKYLSPDKLVWGVCVIVKNGLAFSISNIVDLALGARLIHGTLTISTSTETPMTILGIYGPATKDQQINEPYWKALQIYVEKLYEKNEVSFTQGSRQMVIGGDWSSYRDKETDIYREYELKSCKPQDNYLNDFLETILSNKNIYLHDLMAVSKLMPYDNYTYSKNKFAF
jgi:hypothetical protein